VHDHGVGGGRRGELGGARPHERVHDAVEPLPGLRVREHDRGESGPVQRPVVPQHVLPEGLDDRGQARRAGLDDLPRDPVGVDHDGPPGGQESRDGALARSDPAGQPYAQHARTVAIARE
jgi:hypothetical protein